jgi:hypothetical protein
MTEDVEAPKIALEGEVRPRRESPRVDLERRILGRVGESRRLAPKTKSSSIAWNSAVRVLTDGETRSRSILAIADCVVPQRIANCRAVTCPNKGEAT